MAHCAICGDSDRDAEEDMTPVVRFWSPDDGWCAGRLCRYCRPELRRKPKPEDYAYDLRDEVFSSEDDAISQIYG